MVLRVQWLYSFGKNTIDYQELEMDFNAPNARKVVMRGMENGGP